MRRHIMQSLAPPTPCILPPAWLFAKAPPDKVKRDIFLARRGSIIYTIAIRNS